MTLLENSRYLDEIKHGAALPYHWDKLKNKTILISGATGAIGRMLVDVLMEKNNHGLNCSIIAIGRNENKAKDIFLPHFNTQQFEFISMDINQPFTINRQVDYILHMASNTHPLQYAKDPIGTITTNVIGTNNLLDFGAKHGCKRFLFLSSVEVYGECPDDTLCFNESSLGYIDCNTLRAGYPESKRVGEALCQAYITKTSMEIIIPRLSRVYGPTISLDDSKAVSQFFKKALNDEDIVLKSKGTQFYSYCYTLDAISALVFLLLEGKNGEAYNIASSNSDITLKDLANKISHAVDKKVIFDLPSEAEQKGFSKATRAVLDCRKIQHLGWKSLTVLDEGIQKTLKILK